MRNCNNAAPAVLAMFCIAASAGIAIGDEWGPASEGIQCRLVAISPETDDEAPDLSAVVDSFARGEDVTFGVELKNVSDEAVTLLGVHLGEGWENDSGALVSEELGPALFEFEFSDKSGAPLSRASRACRYDIYLLGALGHTLGPNESLVVGMRPARFSAPMAYRLPPGEYVARVRYRGLSDEMRERIRQVRPGRPEGDAWSGDVASNEVAFRVVGGQRAKPQAELRWGEAKNGLRAAVDFYRRASSGNGDEQFETVPLNSVLDVTLYLQNVSEQPISFVTETWSMRDHLFVTDSAGHEHRVGGASATTGIPTPVRWTLAPGETGDVTAAVIGVSNDNWAPAAFDSHPMCMHLPAKPGAYTIRYVTRMGNAVTFPHSTDWQGELATGETPLVVR